MEITYRTFLHHLLVVVVLIIALVALEKMLPFFQVLLLLKRNAAVLIVWGLLCVLLGLATDAVIRKRKLFSFFLYVFASLIGKTKSVIYRMHRNGKLSLPLDLFLKWSTCSRCVAWWSGLSMSFVIHVLYWPGWSAAIYFAAVGASLSAAIAVGKNLWPAILPGQSRISGLI